MNRRKRYSPEVRERAVRLVEEQQKDLQSQWSAIQSIALGTGTPEPAGLTAVQGLEIIRSLFGTNLVGSDLVKVSPQYDLSGNTALLTANLIFEMLCSFPDCVRQSS